MELLLDLRAWLLVLTFSAVGIAIGLASYHVGRRGLPAVQSRFPKVDPERWEQLGRWYDRWGAGVLVLSAVPFLGILLSAGAGAFGIKLGTFLFWSIVTKTVRNWVILLFLYAGFQRLF